MIQKLIGPMVCVLVLSASVMAQERDDSLIRRARSLEPFIKESAQRYGTDARLLWALCFTESRFRVEAVSPKGARGPMQFMPETAARYGLVNPHDPKAAIDAGARYLRDLLQRFSGRVDLALAAYNAGEGAVQSFLTGRPLLLRTGKIINPRGMVTGGVPPYIETQNYVRAILKTGFGTSALVRHQDDRSSVRSALRKKSAEKISRRSFESSFIDVEP
ncbi:MAG TPA: lytic transglycosylase domain-containing protein [Anaerolineales bacterium]|nr:lytic transglycosylase domain-containing protein [Anaerolineales bacterium]